MGRGRAGTLLSSSSSSSSLASSLSSSLSSSSSPSSSISSSSSSSLGYKNFVFSKVQTAGTVANGLQPSSS